MRCRCVDAAVLLPLPQLCDVVEMADAVYLVMERIEGPDLAAHIAAAADSMISSSPCSSQQPTTEETGPRGLAESEGRKGLREAEARKLFRHLLCALRHAHMRGFLHGDLKPANVRLRERADGSGTIDAAVLVDWGMARRLDKPSNFTIAMGTPLYASPEQLTGYAADQAWGRAKLSAGADVWSLGITLYEMLVGRPPFDAPTHDKLVANVLSLNYALPDALSLEARQIIDAMLQTLPCDRASINELCNDSWTCGGGEGPLPPPLPLSSRAGTPVEGRSVSMHDVESGRSASPLGEAGSRTGRSRYQLLYLLYAGVVAYALLSFSRGGGIMPAFDLEED